jgi:hypothetical protein
MKLSSSVFGVCVVQLKPQLEMLLDLPEKSLTKEIRLTQDLLSLFIDYQIPSDLLSYDGTDELDSSAKVEVVKGHVKKVQDMINDLKQSDLKDARMEADMAYEKSYSGLGSGGLFGGPGPDFGSVGADSFGSAPQIRFRSAQPPKRMAKMQMQMACAPESLLAVPNAVPTQYPPNAPTTKSIIQQNRDIKQTSFDDDKCTDLTKIPSTLDSKFELFGADEKYGGALRSTIIKTGESWTKKHNLNLLSKQQQSILTSDVKKAERNKAFDLLDALSRSGVLPMSHAELHIIIASTHCFDKSVVNTVVQDNINPIEKIERSHLLVASIIHDVNVSQLVAEAGGLERISKHSPMLIKDSTKQG